MMVHYHCPEQTYICCKRADVEPDYHIHISSENDGPRLNLKEVWQYRDLIVLLTRKSFKLTYKQTVLGPAWIFINPLLYSLAYLLVFGLIAVVFIYKKKNL